VFSPDDKISGQVVVKKTTAKNAEKPQRTRRRKGSINSLKMEESDQ
jgi:hypothetical protein